MNKLGHPVSELLSLSYYNALSTKCYHELGSETYNKLLDILYRKLRPDLTSVFQDELFKRWIENQ